MNPSQSLEKAMQRISAASSKLDLAEIHRLTKLATRLKEIEVTIGSLEKEISELDAAIDNAAATLLPSRLVDNQKEKVFYAGELLIEINYPIMGYPLSQKSFCMKTGTATFVAAIESLTKSLGEDILPKLGSIRINRAPLLSRTPEKDFLNQKQNTVYSHHQILDSGWFAFTNTSTDEKIETIKKINRALNSPPGAINARKTSPEEQNSIFDFS
jgi:hypothetical protein